MKVLLRFLAVATLLAMFAGPASAAASYSDKYVLSTDSTFQHRVRVALVTYCASIITESAQTYLHQDRLVRAIAIVNSPDSYATLYADAAALDAGVIADATAAGTVVLTSGNVATQGGLVTDAHLDAAIAAQFNYFVVPL